MSYQRSLTDRLRTAAIVGFAPQRVAQLPLVSFYVERALEPLTSQTGPLLRTARRTLAELTSPPGVRVWIRAAPGVGATTLLRRLALACAARNIGELDAADLLDAWPDPVPTPVLLDLRTLPKPEKVSEWLRADGLAEFAPELEARLAAGECLLLVDNADDPAEYAALAAIVEHYPANRIVAAGYGVAPPAFESFSLAALDREQIDEFVERWLTAIPPGTPAPLKPRSGTLADRIASLQGRLLLNADLLALVAWPPALALCILAERDGLQLPESRADLYRRLVEIRLAEEEPLARQVLTQLAWALQERAAQKGKPALTPDEAGTRTAASPKLLGQLVRSGLVTETADGLLVMPAALRQFLAAEALALMPDFLDHALEYAADPVWEEPLLLAAREQQHATPGELELVRRLAHDVGVAPLVPDSWRRLVIAAEMLRDIDGAGADVAPLRATIAGALVAVLRDTDIPLPERVRAGRILGELGDPRFDEVLPPTVLIDGGSFVLGADVAGFPDEGPPQRLDMPAFRIGMWPVTNREYARFLEANPHQAPPHYWHDPRFNNPSLPVVGVTWHDAAAFCLWLTRIALGERLIPAGAVVRLPLESEWEKAASWGPGARHATAFPWGDQWDAARANTAEGRQAWLTTPVGCFPGGVSRYGATDMTGNVWEWTASEYAGYPGARRPQHQPGHYVLRGSSCVSMPTNARVTYRGSHLPPHYWRYHLGFRIVVGRPLQPEGHSAGR